MNAEVTRLWNKNFIMYAIGMEFALFGGELLKFVIPLYVFMETGNPVLMGTVIAISVVPFVILAPFGGIMADRFNKRKLLGFTNLMTAIAIAAYFGVSGTIEIVPGAIIVMLVIFGLESLNSPSSDASVPLLVPQGDLVKANSAVFFLTMASSLGAPIVGGFILARPGLTTVLFISIGCYLFASIIQFLTKIPYKKQATKGFSRMIINDMRDAIFFILKEKPELGKMLIVVTIFGVTLSPAFSIINVVAPTHLGMGEEVVGLMRGVAGSGGIIGVMILGFLGDRVQGVCLSRPLLFIAGITFIPVGLALQFSNSNILILVLLVASFIIMLACTTVFGIITWSYIGEKAPDNVVGKVMALTFAIMTLANAIGSFLYGLLMDHFIEVPATALFILAGVSVVGALFSRIR
jgi:MFS family permease